MKNVDFESWFGLINSCGYPYFLPVPSIQAMVLRGLGIKLFYGTFSEAMKREAFLQQADTKTSHPTKE